MLKHLLLLTLLLWGWQASSAEALVLSPAILSFQTEPNQTKSATVRVYNDSRQTMQITPSFQDWEYSGKGQKVFRPAGSLPFSLVPFLEMNQAPFLLEKGQNRLVSVKAQVPSNQLGGHHAMLFFLATPYLPPSQQSRLQIAVKLGATLLQENTDSAVIRSRIKNLDIKAEAQGITTILEVENQGNTYLNASGQVAVVDQQNRFIGSFKLPQRYVLRGSSSTLKTTWKQVLKPGEYRFLITYQYRGKSTTIARNLTIATKTGR